MTEKRRLARADAAQAAKGSQKTVHSQHTASGPARSRNHLCRFERRDVPLVDWRNSSRSSDGFRPNLLRSGGAYAHFRSRGGTYVHILKSIDENCAFVDRH